MPSLRLADSSRTPGSRGHRCCSAQPGCHKLDLLAVRPSAHSYRTRIEEANDKVCAALLVIRGNPRGSKGWGLIGTSDLILVGTGSLARGIAYALSQVAAHSLRIAVIGRSTAKVSRMVHIANARAASFGTSAAFSPFAISEFKALAFS